MFITKKYLSRRTMLRGMGVSMALPLLDSMIPAQTALRNTAASPISRLAAFYVPHGATMAHWTPAGEGRGFEFSPILKPLEAYADHLNVITNLAHPEAGGAGSDAGADHQRSAAVFLSGAHPEKGTEARVGITIDQLAAQKIGQDTPLPSLELSIEDVSLSCGAGFSCAYSNTLSWANPTTPLPMENNPQVIFERLFGDGRTDEERIMRREHASSILDSVAGEVTSLRKDLPASDRLRLAEYLEDVREIERRIEKAANATPEGLEIPEAPVGIPADFAEHLKLMFDLQVLAFKAEITRISTLMYARETSTRVFPESGIRTGFHSTSHHADIQANKDNYAKINAYHIGLLGYFLGKLKSTEDGDGSLLDHSMVLYGSGISDGNKHSHDPLPVIVAGGASGKLQGGRHLVFPEHTHMSNLLLAMVNKLGIEQEQFGDSTEMLSI